MDPLLIDLEGAVPWVAGSAWIASGAVLVGAVRLAEDVSIWYGAVLRGDGDAITVGIESNIQDGVVAHTDRGFPVQVGERVSVGHRAVLHGCSVGDDSLIGMGSVLMNGVRIGAGSLVAAGSVLLEGTSVPPGSLVAGLPAKVRRPVTAQEATSITANARQYRELMSRHRLAARLL